MIVENVCKVFYIKKVNLISGMLRISLIFYIFAPLKKGNYIDLFVQDLTLMPVWMRRLITDIIDKNEHYDTLVKSHNR